MDDAHEITLEDLLDGEDPASAQLPGSLEQLLADGFPLGGGLPALAAIENMTAKDARAGAIHQGYARILELQRRAGATAAAL
jgi:hypothetical protein